MPFKMQWRKPNNEIKIGLVYKYKTSFVLQQKLEYTVHA